MVIQITQTLEILFGLRILHQLNIETSCWTSIVMNVLLKRLGTWRSYSAGTLEHDSTLQLMIKVFEC